MEIKSRNLIHGEQKGIGNSVLVNEGTDLPAVPFIGGNYMSAVHT
jgi:hypothetical protein